MGALETLNLGWNEIRELPVTIFSGVNLVYVKKFKSQLPMMIVTILFS